MTVRFQADADLNQILLKATLRREPGIDFRTAHAAGLAALDDGQVLAIAATDGRILVTHDRKTMPKRFAEFVAKDMSAGVIVVPQKLAVNAAVEDLILIWGASESKEWINRIESLPL
jgi:uncharacterized protein with PIN domain